VLIRQLDNAIEDVAGMTRTAEPLRIAVLIKQIPAVEEMRLGEDGRLVRDGMDLEMSAFCRRAVNKSVDLATSVSGSSVTVLTLGPPAAEDALREAIAWGRDRAVDIRGVLVSDAAFAGSDTIATARVLAAALRREGPFDLILTGKNSLDADTGQVPPQLAELLDLPFAAGVKRLDLAEDLLRVGCEHDDSWVELTIRPPAVLSCAERLCEPSKVPPDRRAQVAPELIRTLRAADIDTGDWGAVGSLTTVGACRTIPSQRCQRILPDAPVVIQVREAVRQLANRGALTRTRSRSATPLSTTGGPGDVVAVIADPRHDALTRDLCGLAARLASQVHGSTLLWASHDLSAAEAGSWGADHLVRIVGGDVEEDAALAIVSSIWEMPVRPWAMLASSTTYGREVASRVAAAIGAGLTGDATDVDVVDGRLVAWKPAFGGQLLAAVTATSPTQMVTMRPGVVAPSIPRRHVAGHSTVAVQPRGRIRVAARRQEDSLESLNEADVVIGVGHGVAAEDLHELNELRDVLGAQIGCTRKVTDSGGMPHARQIGVTGRAISPGLYLAIGTSGKFNHMVGVRAAGTVMAINPDRNALVWQYADVGVVAPFQECVSLLVKEIREALP
jgi:electron transfer flavoprotein alpha subunit